MSSRLNLAAPAIRPALPARAVFSGPPGAGKTRTALIVATVLAETKPILFIDTEQESALTYADDFDFVHVPFRPPYDPRDLAATLIEAGDQYDVIIVDSLSHFWRGEGGVLDKAGGKFSNWKDARPMHETMVQAFLTCKAHFIGCARAKTEHVQEVDPKSGKQVVRKLGMAVIQADTLEYELNVACELDMDHSFVISKSRTVAVPVGRVFKPEQAEVFAEEYRDWLKGGEPPAPAEFVTAIRDRIAALPDDRRKACKASFVAQLGRPDTLPESRMAAAEALVASFEESLPAASHPTASAGAGSGNDKGTDDGTLTGVGVSPAVPEVSGGGDAGTPPAGVASPGVSAPDREAPSAPQEVEPAATHGEVGTAPAGGVSPPPGGKNVTGGEGTPSSVTTGVRATPTPSGDAPTPLKVINERGYMQINKRCRAIQAEFFPADDMTCRSKDPAVLEAAQPQWAALNHACSGGRARHLSELTPDEASVFRTRCVDLADGRATWAETDDPRWLGWTLTYKFEETAA